ncbi:TMV resistance protein N [Vitis vinifera]|uniref:ADP-ribosyl cyclase/cyclic ADP-ribose hydrolase n=1 Tax=Vitis vinifera TaxID=29760 RepID=A0A438JDQ6_VITVI|nr:TMV resistance protein N [Vitis vinifera]
MKTPEYVIQVFQPYSFTAFYLPIFWTEAHVIEEITSTVWKSLNREFLHVEKNFVGMDRRRASSTYHLYAALYQKGIRTFRLDEIRGEEVASALFKAIEKSRCILVVLSKYFAHSRWCLDELVKIMECRNQNGKVILPVFYHVDPSDVRKEEGWYGEALAQHESRNIFGHKTQRWRAALREVGNLS